MDKKSVYHSIGLSSNPGGVVIFLFCFIRKEPPKFYHNFSLQDPTVFPFTSWCSLIKEQGFEKFSKHIFLHVLIYPNPHLYYSLGGGEEVENKEAINRTFSGIITHAECLKNIRVLESSTNISSSLLTIWPLRLTRILFLLTTSPWNHTLRSGE